MVETSSYNSRLYPDIEAARYGQAYATANAPPHESERWPLTAAPPVVYAQPDPYNNYYVPPSYGPPPEERRPCHHHRDHRSHHECDGCKGEGFILTTLRLGLFHLFNALLGVTAFVAVVTSVHIAIGLIPLCCVGLLLFRGVVVLVQWLATLDVKLSNSITAPGSERVLIADAGQPLGGFEGLRLSPELSYFSPVSLLGALYFATVKFVMGIVSLVVVSLFAVLPLVLLGFSSDDGNDDNDWIIEVHHHKKVDLREHPLTFYVVWGCLVILSVVAMHVAAWLSRALTQFFCCERVSASENAIPIVQYPSTAATATMYGSNIPTSYIQT